MFLFSGWLLSLLVLNIFIYLIYCFTVQWRTVYPDTKRTVTKGPNKLYILQTYYLLYHY
jgi:hypothetical protein